MDRQSTYLWHTTPYMDLRFLRINTQQSVVDGHHFAKVTAVGIEVGHRSGSYSVVESPWRSFLWQLRRLQQAFEFIGASEILFDFCQYGEAWQKRTRLKGTLPYLSELEKL